MTEQATATGESATVDYVWRSVPSPFRISDAATTLEWFMPASSTYVRVPLGARLGREHDPACPNATWRIDGGEVKAGVSERQRDCVVMS